ncbi:UNVERIFIED_CONTAM: putative mitochondrial protein [Sesamum radiatum]|uniref:Mitochondrial protein n=1 Tax=Sesamum radiatum TaxID=300843 RepID=A0AAW2V4S2_SESRA
MKSWLLLKDVKGLLGFLGLTGYYRKFIKDNGTISRPLTKLLKKDGFFWTDSAIAAFEQLKAAMVSAPVLALPNFAKPFVVEMDACDKGIGSVLMQDHRPTLYKKGCENKVADALSHREHPECAVVTVVIPNWVTDIVRNYDGDDEFLRVIQAKSIDDAAYPMFSQQGEFYGRRGGYV